jgi:hypothetical protein
MPKSVGSRESHKILLNIIQKIFKFPPSKSWGFQLKISTLAVYKMRIKILSKV